MCFVLVHEYLQYNHSGNYIATPHTCLIMTVESRMYSEMYMNWNSICTHLSSSQISKSLFKEEKIYYSSLRICETERSSLKYGYFYCDIIHTHTHTIEVNTKCMATACRNMWTASGVCFIHTFWQMFVPCANLPSTVFATGCHLHFVLLKDIVDIVFYSKIFWHKHDLTAQVTVAILSHSSWSSIEERLNKLCKKDSILVRTMDVRSVGATVPAWLLSLRVEVSSWYYSVCFCHKF